MTSELSLTLAALALVDSLSVGTLLLPIFFLIAPRLRVGRVLLYLATIAGFYALVGVLLLFGASTLLETFEGVLETPVALGIQLVVGAGLLLASFLVPTKPKEGDDPAGRPGRLARWRAAALEGPRPGVVMVLALGAGLIEVATMLPYLGAIGLLSNSPLDLPTRILVLLAYCALMIAPALVLLLVRLVARRLLEPALQRLAAWLTRTGAETTAWVIGIVGFLLARDAANRLGLFEFLDRLGS